MNTPETLILRELLAHEKTFVSGTALAAKAGMSRVAIWQHMEKLRSQGFEFEAVRSRGYRLSVRPEGLNSTLIRAFLPLRDRGLTLTLLDHVDSTNDEAARELANGRSDPFLILAHRQLGGRGRFGRRWMSEPNGNLYASFAFRPRIEPVRMPTFTLWMGANLCDLIANFFRVTPGLKWPNDLVFNGRKAGGMLTEARIDSDQIRDLVFGLGLNLRTPAGGWQGELALRATALDAHVEGPIDINKFTAALAGRVLLAYERFLRGDHTPSLADLWNRYDVLRGQRVTGLQGEQRLTGIASGIDEEGCLLLRSERGGIERLRAGEVTLEKKPGS
ncbi:MAG: biotin--[acetyl-CoA-carboxylase] ligase [Opitutaceae bacterium]|nr:biotin--[acetyl-CoA-carboxylase] ligase [Opitutaceae bacterium]